MSAERRDLPAIVGIAAPVGTALSSSLAVPAMVARAGNCAAKRFLDFFAASIENDNTRMAYYRAVCSFFAWLDQRGIGEIADIEPFHVAAYIKALKVSEPRDRSVRERAASRPTVKQHLAAIRMLFDWLIDGQVLAINPAHAVRGPKHVVKRGKTPVLTEDQARRLLTSLKIVKKTTLPDGSEAEAPWLVGLRDRALIGVMVYTFARISAVVACRSRTTFPMANAGGCGCKRKAASATRCRRTTSSSSSSTSISTRPASAIAARPLSSVRRLVEPGY
jgi:integrase/recombinase XerD